jgi:hypothetical protein
MKDSASRCHPLHVARPQLALVAKTVAVAHRSGEDVGNGLDPAMRMPWKSGQVCRRVVVPKIVKQKEWIEIARVAETECAAKVDASPFNRGL